ncbi:Fe-S protein assembly co-chaperone HscB [Portibacter marinus]|uniref:Fe-S protein assembly co-chaperone HscB n=1 Tax=Portibacter marinus TaxID=2898660 RepID=UPI001F1C51F4|nr:Fe-S protein assembly co-chaperone HscB [Portibacter marinus]
MNYFEFYNLPVSLSIDEALLKQRFYANSKQFHPDFFTLDGVEKQMEALEQSTLNNTAYKTLIDFDKRLRYLLKLKGILKEEGDNQIPQEFLMEMMDVNEAVMELQFDFNQSKLDQLEKDVDDTKKRLKAGISEIIPKSDEEMSESDYELLKEFYLKNKYLKRLEENIEKIQS